MPGFAIPAYCATCERVFPSPIHVEGVVSGLRFDGNTTNCPSGHRAQIVDGTYDIVNGLLRLRDSGPGFSHVLDAIQRLTARAASYDLDQRTAAEEIASVLPDGAALAFRSMAQRDISAALKTIGAIVGIISGLVGTVGVIHSLASPAPPSVATPAPPPPQPIVNVTVSPQIIVTTGDRTEAASPIKREQARRLRQEAAKRKKPTLHSAHPSTTCVPERH